MKAMTMTWTGIRPMVMGNPQGVELSNPLSMESRRLNAEMKKHRKKGDSNLLIETEEKMKRNDWESSAYWDDERKSFYLPDTVILACLRGGAAVARKGKDIDRAAIISEPEVYIQTKKHNSIEQYFKDEAFRLSGPCKIPPKTGALIWKCRCMIPVDWKVTFTIEYEETIVAEKSIIDAAESAGRLVGVGGWRPKFGRFTVS